MEEGRVPMAPTDNLFWVYLWSVDDEGCWTLSKPSQVKGGKNRKDRRKGERMEGRKEGRKERK